MRIRRSTTKAIAVLAAMAFIAAACGGGSDTNPIADEGEPVVNAIATTAPVTAPAPAPANDSTIATGESETAGTGEGTPAEDPWEVNVLYVKDDFQIVPAFDGPGGNEIKIYDRNEIDGIDLEYPLFADTVFGNRLALVVEEFDSSGNWAKVKVPVRPNNTTAWVQTAFFNKETHNYHITIDVSDNTVFVYRGEEDLLPGGQLAVSGRDSRKTPIVRSYIDEKIRGETLSPAYGDWVLSIAAFSEDLGTFGGGGMPKLALHGTNQPELMGQYVSSGCVRIPNEVVSFIADTVPVGTIVDIVA